MISTLSLTEKSLKSDYAQGSELQANTRQAQDSGKTDYKAGISAEGNKRTHDLGVLKEMLQRYVDDFGDVDDQAVGIVASATKKKAKGFSKKQQDAQIDQIQGQIAETFSKKRTGYLQSTIDGYFSVRLIQMLNQTKTAFVGVPSALLMSVGRPLINTPYNIKKATQLEGVPISRKVQYAMADLTATYEYMNVYNALWDTLKSSGNTILNKGDNFLYRDRHAYLKDELAEATEPTHRVKRQQAQVRRREAARNAKHPVAKGLLKAKATVMNSRPKLKYLRSSLITEFH